MIQDFLIATAGLAVLIASFVTLWLCRPRTGGGDRWFAGTAHETTLALAITSGLVIGLGMLVTGLLSTAGAR